METSNEFVMEKHFDPVGARVGMWIFLFTELLLFGAMFLLYAAYLDKYPDEFHYAAGHLNQFVGAMNTLILLTSSLTMALAIATLQRHRKKTAVFFLIVTILLAIGFLINKYFEWGAKIHHGLYPGSEVLATHPKGEIIFYGLYYTMTGLHGLHVIIGMTIMGFMLWFILKKKHIAVSLPVGVLEKMAGQRLKMQSEDGREIWSSDKIDDHITEIDVVVRGDTPVDVQLSNITKLENAGLYWHLVDIIWIFLFPLFYLISL